MHVSNTVMDQHHKQPAACGVGSAPSWQHLRRKQVVESDVAEGVAGGWGAHEVEGEQACVGVQAVGEGGDAGSGDGAVHQAQVLQAAGGGRPRAPPGSRDGEVARKQDGLLPAEGLLPCSGTPVLSGKAGQGDRAPA